MIRFEGILAFNKILNSEQEGNRYFLRGIVPLFWANVIVNAAKFHRHIHISDVKNVLVRAIVLFNHHQQQQPRHSCKRNADKYGYP